MKSIKKNLCGCIIHIVEIELGKNSQFFVEITIMTRPPIYLNKLLKNYILQDKGRIIAEQGNNVQCTDNFSITEESIFITARRMTEISLGFNQGVNFKAGH